MWFNLEIARNFERAFAGYECSEGGAEAPMHKQKRPEPVGAF
jgi:hypothetical protein